MGASELIHVSQQAPAESICAVGHPQTTPSLWPRSVEQPRSSLQTHQACLIYRNNLHGSKFWIKAGDRLKT